MRRRCDRLRRFVHIRRAGNIPGLYLRWFPRVRRVRFSKTLAYVIELAAESDYDGPIKEIIEVIDFDRGLTEEQIALAREISNATKSSLSHCLRLMYPAFMQSRLRRFVKALRSESLPGHLQDLFKNRKRIPLTAEVMPYYKDIRAAAERGDLRSKRTFTRTGKEK